MEEPLDEDAFLEAIEIEIASIDIINKKMKQYFEEQRNRRFPSSVTFQKRPRMVVLKSDDVSRTKCGPMGSKGTKKSLNKIFEAEAT